MVWKYSCSALEVNSRNGVEAHELKQVIIQQQRSVFFKTHSDAQPRNRPHPLMSRDSPAASACACEVTPSLAHAFEGMVRAPSFAHGSTCWAVHGMRNQPGRLCPHPPAFHTRSLTSSSGMSLHTPGGYMKTVTTGVDRDSRASQHSDLAAAPASAPTSRHARRSKAGRLARAWRLKRRSIVSYYRKFQCSWYLNMRAYLWRIGNPVARKVMERYGWQLRSWYMGFRHGY